MKALLFLCILCAGCCSYRSPPVLPTPTHTATVAQTAPPLINTPIVPHATATSQPVPTPTRTPFLIVHDEGHHLFWAPPQGGVQ